jgi:hypothetical protein
LQDIINITRVKFSAVLIADSLVNKIDLVSRMDDATFNRI